MTSLWGLGPPADREVYADDNHRYATWDAAYVLGSLTAGDRREFEAHMARCPACREAIAELSGVPFLLSQLDIGDLAALNESDQPSVIPTIPPDLLASLLATVRWRRHRTRLTTWMAAAAAALLAIAVFVGFHSHFAASSPPQASVSALQMAQVGTKLLTSTVWVTPERWGTSIKMRSDCLAPLDAPHDRLAMVVVGRDRSQTRLATWVAEPGHTATPAGSISTAADQIAAIQVVYADTGQVLLERSLQFR